jgi:predicted transcriptional regulator
MIGENHVESQDWNEISTAMIGRISLVANVLIKCPNGINLVDIVSELGVSKQTTIRWLACMEDVGLLLRTSVISGKRGRPDSRYQASDRLKKFQVTNSRGSLVLINFKTLASLCRFQSGGLCADPKSGTRDCNASDCPKLVIQSA